MLKTPNSVVASARGPNDFGQRDMDIEIKRIMDQIKSKGGVEQTISDS